MAWNGETDSDEGYLKAQASTELKRSENRSEVFQVACLQSKRVQSINWRSMLVAKWLNWRYLSVRSILSLSSPISMITPVLLP